MSTSKTVVNSWNEWDPLKHVIVGVASGTMVQAPEPAIQRDWPEYGFPNGNWGPLPDEIVAKADEQLDNLADVLEKRGIRVDRPTPLDFSQQVQTPDWVQDSMFGCMPPRDVLLPIGNEILETTMAYRSRWYEYLCYRPLLEQYYKEDPNFRWESVPKSRFSDDTYQSVDFWSEFNRLTVEEQLERNTANKTWNLTEKEPILEAATVARFGQDLFVQPSTVTNRSGIEWMRRHFPNHRVHEVSFKDPTPIHIDATFVPLRPGLVLNNREKKPLQQGLYELFEKNDWEIVECVKPAHTDMAKLSWCTPYISMNILMLDENTVCVEEHETDQMEQFYALGFEVIPVPFWEVSPCGGGLHCATLDVYRDGTLQDYFPKQVNGI